MRMSIRTYLSYILALTLPAAAFGQYHVFLNFNDIRVGPQYDILGAHTFEGDSVYAIVRGIESIITPTWESQITRVDNIDGTPTTTLLVSHSQWVEFTGIVPENGDTILPGDRMRVIGDYLQFVDQATDSVYRVHKQTGALTLFASKAAIGALVGTSNVRLLDAVDFDPDNNMYFYEETSDHIVKLAPDGTLSLFITKEQLATYFGYTPVNFVSTLTFDAAGNLIWALGNNGSSGNKSGAIHMWEKETGMFSQLVDELTIQLATFSFLNVNFNNIYAAPDCLIYFYDQNSDSILYFDPADPVNTIDVFLTESELENGPAGTDFVGAFEARGKELTWNHSLTRLSPHIYAKRMAGIPAVAADFNGDGYVDQVDVDFFTGCATGPAVPYDVAALPETCDMLPDCRNILPADLDQDGDVDQDDFGRLQRCIDPSEPALAGCAD